MVRVPGGTRIACHLSGDPARPALVLLHGLGEGAASWADVAPRLASRFHVVNIDLRGHGASDWPGDYSFPLMRDDVIRVLEALNLKDVVLVGHSMGGTVAYLVSSARPDLVARLIVEDAPPPYPRVRQLPERPADPFDFDWAVVPAILAQVNDASRRWWAVLPGIVAPTLLIGGGPTSSIPQDLLAEASALIPDCMLLEIPAGHHIHECQPDAFADAVLDWLGGTGPAL
ncbi:MAG: alpha/beta fold hydrolase [Mycetocola sp.]